jgi:hypothetical protein
MLTATCALAVIAASNKKAGVKNLSKNLLMRTGSL